MFDSSGLSDGVLWGQSLVFPTPHEGILTAMYTAAYPAGYSVRG
jgi:hypothetical protein